MKLKNEVRFISSPAGKMKTIVLRPENQKKPLPGILWFHGGGYALGMAEMVYFTGAKLLAKKYGAVVLAPRYCLSGKAPYPAAVKDCYAALLYMWKHADELGIRRDCIIVGGESAGGGLAAAVCLAARDRGEVNVALQLPLYPMLDCEDTDSSRDNHGYVWNTKRNHWGWAKYLGALYGTDHVPKYASPSRETDYSGLPPAFTYVGDGEPFYRETLTYIENLKKAGVEAEVRVYYCKVHAFTGFLFFTDIARNAKRHLCRAYAKRVREICGQDGFL